MTVLLLVEVTPAGDPESEQLIGYQDQVLAEVTCALRQASLASDGEGEYIYPWKLHSVRQAVAP